MIDLFLAVAYTALAGVSLVVGEVLIYGVAGVGVLLLLFDVTRSIIRG